MIKIIILLIFSLNLRAQADSVAVGQLIDADYINNLQSSITQAKSELNTIASELNNKFLYEETLLWEGNQYIDGSSNYDLWNISQHQAWDSIKLFVSYDSGSVPVEREIFLGPNYSYGTRTQINTNVITTYSSVFRRVFIRTTGIGVWNGSGSYWYLRRVVGVKKRKVI